MSQIEHISLRGKYNHQYSKPFNFESHAISRMYWWNLKKIKSDKIKTINIIVSNDWSIDQIQKIHSVVGFRDINIRLNFELYFSLGKYERKKMQLAVIHEGMIKIAEEEGWQIDPLLDAYNKCMEDNLEYKFSIGKQKSSPNRKYKINFWCNWDIDIFEVFWVLYDKNGKALKKEKFIEKEPYQGEFIYYIDYKWIDNESVLLEDKYKYGKKEKWKIDLSNAL